MKITKETYDQIYKNSVEYDKHYSESVYYGVWCGVLAELKKIENISILEIGCGVGQFATMLFKNNITNYVGIDYSDVAIKKAKKTDGTFFCCDLMTSDIPFNDYNTVIALEVLEHLENDLAIFDKLKTSNIVLSVPNFDSKTHYRYFKTINDVIERYSPYVDINKTEIYGVGKKSEIFVLYGKIKK